MPTTTDGPRSGGTARDAAGEAGGSAAVAAAGPAGAAVRVAIEHPARLNYALQQNAVPAVRRLRIENAGAAPLADVAVRVTSEPEFSAPWEARIESIPPGCAHVIEPVDLALSPGRLAGLLEREAAWIAVEVASGGNALCRETFPVELLAYNEWPGAGSLPEILAAFVLPNHPSVAIVLAAAARLLGERTGDPALTGYQSGDPARAREIAACVFEAIRDRRIAYSSPPASYEASGQKVRTPDQVIDERLATCLDLAALYAACIEQCGLNPLLVLVEGHALAGLWLEAESFPDAAVTEPLRLRKRADLDRIVLVETTAAALPGKIPFPAACQEARRRLDQPETFLFAVDVAAARRQRIRPLPLRGSRPYEAIEPPAGPHEDLEALDRPRPQPLPARAPEPSRPAAEPEAPGGRLGRWKRRLLDLSLRNRLLNCRETKKSVRLLCPDLASFEDALAEGKEFTLHPRPALMEGADPRAASVHAARTGRNAIEEYLRSEMSARRLRAPLPAEELDRRLLEIYRGSRLSMEESGANTLHLALGFLLWYENDASREPRRAPILLLPLTLSRRSIKEGFRLALADDEARINITLLEKLEKEFHIRVDGLSAMPQDASGLDVASILRAFRQAVLDAHRWDVVDEAWMGLFSFNKFLMWLDLEERAPALLENGVVRHLVETPNLPFDPGGPFPEPERLDDERPAVKTFCLRDADSSQLAAVFAAADGRSFVLEGPPGTGKSQTITNLISHCLAEGKSVLFVAEKQAALNVVHRRLNEVGLGPFCLELHSSKASKQLAVRQLGEALAAAGIRSPADWEARARKLDELRARLNHYARALHRPRGTGESLFQLISALVGLRGSRRFQLGSDAGGEPDPGRVEAMREAAQGVASTGAALGDVASHPWRGVRREDWGPEVGAAAQALAGELDAAARSIAAALEAAGGEAGLPAGGWSLAGLERLGEALRLLLESPGPPAALLEGDWPANRSRLAGWIEKGRRRAELRERLRDYRDSLLGEDLEELRASIARALGGIPPFSWFSLWRLRRRLKPFRSGGRLPRGRRLAEDIEGAIERRGLDAEFGREAEEGRRLLGERWKDGEADWGEAERILGWAERFLASLAALSAQAPAGSPPAAGRWIPLACGERARLAPDAPAGRSLRALASGLEALGGVRSKLSELLDMDETAAWGDAAEAGILERLESAAASWTAQPWALREWCAWRRARNEAAGKGLELLARACEQGDLAPADIPAAFERSFREERLERVYAEEPLLRNFFSPDHEKSIERFRALDRELLDHARQVVVARLSARVPPPIAGADATQSEMGILQRELKKQRRHLPVRQLVEKLPNLLPRLKPCLLMSPLSVAQYLDPRFPAADIVVFDEASQIPVWDAVGAISRGGQLVVVGDSRQLPPTMFFEKMEEEQDEDPGEEEVVELESILDECVAAGLPRRYLEWHYRSRHESLIAFSNHHYYENRLITFPGAVERSGRLGVSLVRSGGVYDRGGTCTNPIEAGAVVAEVTRRARDPNERGRSIGVVTFSLAQQLLVEDLLEVERRKDPDVDILFTDDVPEPIFVKNLENVQGDERDVILFSVGYGPDSRGRATMNFGPLNREGGQRRLNVAITRAREQVVVFTSIGAEQIDLDRTRAVGVEHLKAFLDYAERGPASLGGAMQRSAAEFDSPFEKAVRDALLARGWEADAKVGCSGYRIDLAVKDPRRSGAYLLGIECDGTSYRGARTARDRDRLRGEVLLSLGWKLVRIWSSDWWHQPQKVIEELDRRLREALEEPAAEAAAPGEMAAGAAAPAEEPPQDAPVPEPAPPQPAPAGFHLAIAGMQPYRPYHPEEAPPPDLDYFAGAATGAIRSLLAAVIASEGPVSLELAARRIAALWRIERVTRRVRDRLLEAAGRGGSSIDLVDGFLWPPGVRPDSYTGFRVPGDDPRAARDPEDIPPEEAANAAAALLRLHISLPLEDLAREAGRLFGFQRLGPKVRRSMERGIRLLAARGGCSLEANTVSLRARA